MKSELGRHLSLRQFGRRRTSRGAATRYRSAGTRVDISSRQMRAGDYSRTSRTPPTVFARSAHCSRGETMLVDMPVCGAHFACVVVHESSHEQNFYTKTDTLKPSAAGFPRLTHHLSFQRGVSPANIAVARLSFRNRGASALVNPRRVAGRTSIRPYRCKDRRH